MYVLANQIEDEKKHTINLYLKIFLAGSWRKAGNRNGSNKKYEQIRPIGERMKRNTVMTHSMSSIQ